MFTGIIQEIGTIASVRRSAGRAWTSVRARFDEGPLARGESIAVDGACLTAARIVRGGFEADLSRETLARTTAGSWRAGRRVNLERALQPKSRLGGHFVQGHVDGRGEVVFLRSGPDGATLRVRAPEPLRPLIAEKGSIAVDGVSLTVAALGEDWFEVALIPHTLAATNLADRRAADAVNLEADLLARHLARLLETGAWAPPPAAPRARRPGAGRSPGGARAARERSRG